MLDMLAKELNVNPKIKILPHQKGDVMYTRASSAKAKRELGLKPGMSLPKGIQEFAQWFRKNEAFLLSLKDIHS
jgi:nucleoside-diphosphate-sugar epimerase